MSQESQAISHNISMLLTEGRSAEARAELERLLSLDADDPDARSLAGDVYAYTGAHSAAYKQYNAAAETFNRLGRADMALAVHHKILELDPAMLDAATQTRIRLLNLLVAAEDAIVQGANERAVAGYKEAIRQFPNHTITYQRLANLLVRLNRLDEAAEQSMIVARAFYAHGVLAKARPYFERALELRPDLSEALTAMLACLEAEGKLAEGERFQKAAAQAHLQAGRNEEAAGIFESLPPETRDNPSPLGVALLQQSGEVGQADRMAQRLDLVRPEIQDWFKAMGRAALERGDSVSADAYFRWSQGPTAMRPAEPLSSAPEIPTAESPSVAVEAPPPVAVPEPEPVAPSPPPVAAPPPGLGVPPPPPGLGVPPPPPGLGVPPPPPGLGVPPPPPPSSASLGVPASPPSMPVAPSPPPPVASAPLAVMAEPPARLDPPALAPTPAPSLGGSAAPLETPPEDRSVLQTMGEMCLAEEMFEEAKQVFQRLTRADPRNEAYWDLLNRARGGLGLSPIFAAMAPARPQAPVPPPHILASAPLAPAVDAAAPPETAPSPAPEPAPPAPAPAPAPLSEPPKQAQLELPPLAPPVLRPLPPPPVPAVPAVPALRGASNTPKPPPSAPLKIPVDTDSTGVIQRTQYVVQLGELPPAVAGNFDESDDIIE